MLFEFGKFPAFEKNWNSSEFNETKVLIFSEKEESGSYYSHRIQSMLHFELELSQDLITEIVKDYEQFLERIKEKKYYNFRYTSYGCVNETTIRYVYYDILI